MQTGQGPFAIAVYVVCDFSTNKQESTLDICPDVNAPGRGITERVFHAGIGFLDDRCYMYIFG